MKRMPKTRARHPDQTQTPTTNTKCNTSLAFKHYLLQAKKNKRSPSSSSSSSSSSSGVRKFSRHVLFQCARFAYWHSEAVMNLVSLLCVIARLKRQAKRAVNALHDAAQDTI